MTIDTSRDDLPEGIQPGSLQRVPVSMVVSDPSLEDNPLIFVNDAFEAITGYDASEAVGRNCRFLQGPKTDPEAVTRLREAIADGRDVALDILNYRKDGTPFRNHLLITPVGAERDAGLYFLGVQHEVSATNGYAERAAELDSQLRELQHRVKNHLSLIVSLIRAQAKGLGAREAAALLAKRIETISLLYNQVDIGPDYHKQVDLADYVRSVCIAMQALSDTVAVEVNIETDAVTVKVERAARIGLILSEVLTNALQHAFDDDTDRSPAVKVSLLCDAETIRLRVRDNGGGLGEARWPKSESLGGRIVDDLVSRVDGELTVDSSDAGVTVTLTFPHG